MNRLDRPVLKPCQSLVVIIQHLGMRVSDSLNLQIEIIKPLVHFTAQRRYLSAHISKIFFGRQVGQVSLRSHVSRSLRNCSRNELLQIIYNFFSVHAAATTFHCEAEPTVTPRRNAQRSTSSRLVIACVLFILTAIIRTIRTDINYFSDSRDHQYYNRQLRNQYS